MYATCPLCAQEGDDWKPPSAVVDKRWHYKARIGKVLTESLRCETDLIQAVAIILNEWDGEGATAIVLPATTIDKYVQSVKNLTLRGPRIDWRTVGVLRYIFASVPVARLLMTRRTEIRALLNEHYVIGRPPPPTKEELLEQMDQQRGKLEDQIADLQTKVVRAGDAKRQAVARSLVPRKDWQVRCRERLKSDRQDRQEKCMAAAEAAAQANIDRINRLRNEANARARLAECREETAINKATERLEALKQARESNATLVAESEAHSAEQACGVEAIAKLNRIPQLRTIAARRSDGKGCMLRWPNWMRGAIMEMHVNGTPSSSIPQNIVTMVAYLVPFQSVSVPNVRFCRHMRGEQIVTLTLAALIVMWAGKWRQFFTDGTSRRQTHFINAIIGIDGPDGELLPIILAAAVIGSGESSEQQVNICHRGESSEARCRQGNAMIHTPAHSSPTLPQLTPTSGEAPTRDIRGIASGSGTHRG